MWKIATKSLLDINVQNRLYERIRMEKAKNWFNRPAYLYTELETKPLADYYTIIDWR